jgi:transcription elongation factor GreA
VQLGDVVVNATPDHAGTTSLPDEAVGRQARRSGLPRRPPDSSFPVRTSARPTGRAHPFLCVTASDATPMIEELKRKLGEEVERLQHELNVTIPAEIRKAVEHGDLRENSEYKAALERQQFVQARLGQLRQRLSRLSSVDVSQIPTDRVGLGSKVTVRDEATGKSETFNLVFGEADFDENQVTMSSPIGRALLGKAVGETAILKLPTVTRRLKVTELVTIHESLTA